MEPDVDSDIDRYEFSQPSNPLVAPYSAMTRVSSVNKTESSKNIQPLTLGTVDGLPYPILADLGSTDNIMDPSLVQKLRLQVTSLITLLRGPGIPVPKRT